MTSWDAAGWCGMDQAAPRCQDLPHSGAVLGSPLRWGQAGFPVPPGARVGPRTPPQCLESSGAAPSVGTGDSPAVSSS